MRIIIIWTNENENEEEEANINIISIEIIEMRPTFMKREADWTEERSDNDEIQCV